MIQTELIGKAASPSEEILRKLKTQMAEEKQEGKIMEKTKDHENTQPSEEFWSEEINRQYQKAPFNLNASLAQDAANFFTEHSKAEFRLYPELMLENLAGYYMAKCDNKDEYLYYKRIQESVEQYNSLCLALMNFYPSNPSEYTKIQKELSDDLAILDIDTRMVQPLRTSSMAFDDDYDEDVPF